jgi:hypothetical protein
MRVGKSCSTTCASPTRRTPERKRRDSAKAQWRLIGIAKSGDYLVKLALEGVDAPILWSDTPG